METIGPQKARGFSCKPRSDNAYSKMSTEDAERSCFARMSSLKDTKIP